MKKVTLFPYVINDGQPTLPDSYIIALLDRAEKDGTLDTFFCNDKKYTKQMFLDKVRLMHRSTFFVVLVDNTESGFGFIDSQRWDHGFIHFCVFSEYWGDCVDYCKEVYRQLHEDFGFSLIMGVVPVNNKYALAWAEKIGTIPMDTILPKYFYNGSKHIAGKMFFTTR